MPFRKTTTPMRVIRGVSRFLVFSQVLKSILAPKIEGGGTRDAGEDGR